MKAVGKAMDSNGGVEPVDFRKRKPLLPESLPGMRRTCLEGQKSAAFGIGVSVAEAEYKNDAEGIIYTSTTGSTLVEQFQLIGLGAYLKVIPSEWTDVEKRLIEKHASRPSCSVDDEKRICPPNQ